MIAIKTDEIIKAEGRNKEIINEIMKLYGEFLLSYDELNTKFSLNNPIEIFSIFCQLLKHGYLSKDKSFVNGDDLTFDNYRDQGLCNACSILAGYGECRQSSKMLVDVLKTRNVFASQITLCSPSFTYDYSHEINPVTTEEELFHWIQTRMRGDEDTQEELLSILTQLSPCERKHIKLERTPVRIEDFTDYIVGNHEICIAKQGKKVYYLDPINYMVYSKKHNHLINYDLDYTIKRIGTLFPSGVKGINLKDYFRILGLLLIKQTSSEIESEELLLKMEMLFRENKDIFETFYNTNKELYESVSNKASQLIRIRYK